MVTREAGPGTTRPDGRPAPGRAARRGRRPGNGVGAAVATTGPTRPLSVSGIAHWRPAGHYGENTVTAGEGVATVSPARSCRHRDLPRSSLGSEEPGRRGLEPYRRSRLGRRLHHRRLPGSEFTTFEDVPGDQAVGRAPSSTSTNWWHTSCTTTPLTPSRRDLSGWWPGSGAR